MPVSTKDMLNISTYGYLKNINNNVAYFIISPLDSFKWDVSPFTSQKNTDATNAITAESLFISSILPVDINSSDVEGITWPSQADGTKGIILDPAIPRKLTQGKIYKISIHPSSRAINGLLKEGKRVKIEELDKQGLDAIGKNNIVNNKATNPKSQEPVYAKGNIKIETLNFVNDSKSYLYPIPLVEDIDKESNPETYLRIGYTKLAVPPSSIVIKSSNGLESVEILRAEGAQKAIDNHTQVSINIAFTVVGITQINNILIPILNQVERMPFLPVENIYLNVNWNIDAIAVNNITVTTVEGVPNALGITMDCEPFAWWSYLQANEDYASSFCWPLFKLWCETRSKSKRLTSDFTGKFKILIPDRAKQEAKKRQAEKLGILETVPQSQVISNDATYASQALVNFKTNTYVETDNLKILVLNGKKYAAIKFESLRNVVLALKESDIIVCDNILVRWNQDVTSPITEVKLSPNAGYSSQDKAKLRDSIISKINASDPGTIPKIKMPWFLIPESSSIWPLITKVGSSIKPTEIAEEEFNELTFSTPIEITSISSQVSNQLAPQYIQLHSLPAHQYLGKTDHFVSIQGIVYGEGNVEQLNAAIEEVRYLARIYRPLPFDFSYVRYMKIENEVLDVLGLKYFIPLSLSVQNVQGFPHVYSFQLDLIEYTDTQRNMELFERMDDAIYNWLKGLPSTQVDAATRYKSWVEGKPILDAFYIPQEINTRDPQLNYIETTREAISSKQWRVSLQKLRMRFMELYPDMKLPTKEELAFWIDLMQYYVKGNKVTREENKRLIDIAFSDIPLSKETKETILKFKPFVFLDQQKKEQRDLIGFADPDFFCIPDLAFSEEIAGQLDATFSENNDKAKSGNGIIVDQFNGKRAVKAGRSIEDPEPKNGYTTNKDKAFIEYQRAKLEEHKKLYIEKKYGAQPEEGPSTAAPTNIPKAGPIVQQRRQYFSYYNPNIPYSGPSKKDPINLHATSIKSVHDSYKSIVDKASAKFNLAPYLLYALIAQESDGDPTTTGNSSKGMDISAAEKGAGIGLTQIIASENLGNKEKLERALKDLPPAIGPDKITSIEMLFVPSVNIFLGALELSDKIKKHGGDIKKGLKAYRGSGNDAIDEKYANDVLRLAAYSDFLFRDKDNPIKGESILSHIGEAASEVGAEVKTSAEKVATSVGNAARDLGTLVENVTKEVASALRKSGENSADVVENFLEEEVLPTVKKVLTGQQSASKLKINRSLFEDFEKNKVAGRLAAAFPTYLVMVIDGGRWIGMEKLSDHFYGGFGINSIEIVQSRKSPIDVATVTFSNMYGRLTALASSIERDKALDPRRQWTSRPFLKRMEEFFNLNTADLKLRWSQWLNSLMLRPGVRLHIRMGYSADASKLPIKFNGAVSSVPVQDKYVQVIALGDGAELVKKFPEGDSHVIIDKGAESNVPAYQNTGLMNTGKEPRNIVLELFAPKNEFVSAISRGAWLSDSRYGITHFGELDYTPSYGWNIGEVGINVYSSNVDPEIYSSAKQNWLTITGTLAYLRGYTLLGVEVEDASPWDIIKTCRDALPDFVCQVRPFEFRSTLFFGKPWWDFRYEYKPLVENLSLPPTTKMNTEQTKLNIVGPDMPIPYTPDYGSEEKIKNFSYLQMTNKKSFMQFHLISSGHNLISNSVIADASSVAYTNCQGKFIYGGLRTTSIQEGDIMRADAYIFPEYQKTEIFKTGLLSGPLRGFEGLLNLAADVLRLASLGQLDANVSTAGVNISAATRVRDYVADMYQGYNLITGDPTINPWDVVYLQDVNSMMGGIYQVKEVVNHFSIDAGYVTAVSPDCLVGVASGTFADLWITIGLIGKSFASGLLIKALSLSYVRLLAKKQILLKLLYFYNRLKAQKAEGAAQWVYSLYKSAAKGDRIAYVKAAIVVKAKMFEYDALVAADRISAETAKNIKNILTKVNNLIIDLIKKSHSEKVAKEILEALKNLPKSNVPEKIREIFEIVTALSKEDITRGNVELTAEQIAEATKLAEEAKAAKEAAELERNLAKERAAQALENYRAAKKGVEEAESLNVPEYEAKVSAAKAASKELKDAIAESMEKSAAYGKASANATRAAMAADTTRVTSGKFSSLAAGGAKLAGNIFTIACMAISYVIGDMIGRELSSMHSVTIFPLHVNGKEFSAGIEGHLGSVILDPVAGTDDFWASIFSLDYVLRNTEKMPLWRRIIGGALPFIAGILLPGSDVDYIPSNKYKDLSPDVDSFTAFMNRINASISDPVFYQYDSRTSGTISSSSTATTNATENSKGPVYLGVGKVPIDQPGGRLHYVGKVDGLHEAASSATLLRDLNTAATALGYTLGIYSATRAESIHGEIRKDATSRHSRGKAVDIDYIDGVPITQKDTVAKADKLAQYLISNFGYALNVEETGNKKVILWKTMIGGNHYDHMHVSNTN